ncbi:MAG: triose-phosphate isomerase [Bacilli bacterium]|jgi:triosephosphate isomerase
MRDKIIVGNWKMNHTMEDTHRFLQEILPFCEVASQHHVRLGIAPSFLSLLTATQATSKHLLIYAQNCHALPKGAFTGEVSIPMLQEIGVDGVIVGHSERRQYYAETNVDCNQKIKSLHAAKLQIIYCVGETLQQYENGETMQVIEKQLREGLTTIEPQAIRTMVFAYEPVWSIGTGRNASVEIAQSVCHGIRSILASLTNHEVAQEVLIQYGGSVKPENALQYLSTKDIDGVLVGGASLIPESFKALVECLWK